MAEINSIDDANYSHGEHIVGVVELGDAELVRIERIRYVGDSWGTPFDLSYAHGRNRAGERVRIGGLPYQVANGRALKRALYAAADDAGVRLNPLCGGHLTDVLSMAW